MKLNQEKRRTRVLCWTLLLALIAALAVEVGFFMQERHSQTTGTKHSLLQRETGSFDTVGYEVQGNRYTQISDDPQIIFLDVDSVVRSVEIEFGERVSPNAQVQVFYSSEGSGFSELNSEKAKTKRIPSKHLIIDLPGIEAESLRIDINCSFTLNDISVSDEPIRMVSHITNSFRFRRFFTLFVIVALFLQFFAFWLCEERNDRRLSTAELLFCAGCFVYYFLWAVVKPLNYGPDEAMRYDVTKFLFENNRLPVGDELLSPWGFSYAHLPTVLCNQLGYVFMKVASVFTGQDSLLLLSARMVSVCCGAGAVYFLIKTAKQISSPTGKWIMVTLVAVMPQYAFLSSYVNNDIVAFLGIAVILYAWTLGKKETWNWKNTTLLAIGISVCALSYYNSYPWILFSIVFFYATYISRNRRISRDLGMKTAYIVSIVFVLIGYSFIRHIVLYRDLLGFKTSRYFGELYARADLKPSNRMTVFRLGVPLVTMLFGSQYAWTKTAWYSFIGVFGYMNVYCPQDVYNAISLFVVIGGIGALVGWMQCVYRKEWNRDDLLFYGCMAASAIITVALVIYSSYCTDFQPQGRYCYPTFPLLALIVAKGYERWLRLLKKIEYQYAACGSICTMLVAISVFTFTAVYLPS